MPYGMSSDPKCIAWDVDDVPLLFAVAVSDRRSIIIDNETVARLARSLVWAAIRHLFELEVRGATKGWRVELCSPPSKRALHTAVKVPPMVCAGITISDSAIRSAISVLDRSRQ